jgi:hypothetical protein
MVSRRAATLAVAGSSIGGTPALDIEDSAEASLIEGALRSGTTIETSATSATKATTATVRAFTTPVSPPHVTDHTRTVVAARALDCRWVSSGTVRG